MIKRKGQILPDSDFGRILTSLARESDVIVEIGTLNGQGSTACLAAGLIHPAQHMWSVEPDENCWREASEFWHNEPRITFIRGKALDVLDQLPKKIGLLLLDGDDQTSFAEFMALGPHSHYIALDDTKEQKNKQSREFGLACLWKVIADDPDERNGYTVFER